MKHFTLHIRLALDCNAQCTYCSSANNASGRIGIGEFKTALNFIADAVFPKLGVGQDHQLAIEYLGGEMLLIPEREIRLFTEIARDRLGPLVRGLRQGVQSNLIGSERRVLALHDLFGENIGTSWDNYTGQRRTGGSASLYKAILNKSLRTLSGKRGFSPGRVIVVDSAIAEYLEREVRDAISGGYDLVLRPVFKGGSADVSHLSTDELAMLFSKCHKIWSENPRVRIEPFTSLFKRRINRGRADEAGEDSALESAGCPFQHDCAFRSLSLGPDGSLNVCQEMADASRYSLGNAILETFNDHVWRLLARRSFRLAAECRNCQWLAECAGGCMNEAVEAHGDPFARTELCPAWKAVFMEIENDILSGRAAEIERVMAQ
ncbi:MAG: SPASM domain-containing protein [Roseovarius sp.]|nr:SPASM domain-containing protein [Roseovarius sp.]